MLYLLLGIILEGNAKNIEDGRYDAKVFIKTKDGKTIEMHKQVIVQNGKVRLELNKLPEDAKEVQVKINKGEGDDPRVNVWISGTNNIVRQINAGSGINVIGGATETPTVELTNACLAGQILKYDGTTWQCSADQGGNANICATAQANYVQKYTGTELCNSLIYDDGVGVGVNTNTPLAQLDVVTSSATFTTGVSGIVDGGVVLGTAGVSGSTNSAGGIGVAGYIPDGVLGSPTGVLGRVGGATAIADMGYGIYGLGEGTATQYSVGVVGARVSGVGATIIANAGVSGFTDVNSSSAVAGYVPAGVSSSNAVYGEVPGGSTTANSNTAVLGYATGTNTQYSIGVVGIRDATGLGGTVILNAGVSGYSNSGIGVVGVADSGRTAVSGGVGAVYSMPSVGVIGTANVKDAIGVVGMTFADSTYGVYAHANTDHASNVGVVGLAGTGASTLSDFIGVYGEALNANTSYGIGGYFVGDWYGVVGVERTDPSLGYAVFAAGDMAATGTKPFVIDHPLDPANKELLHYAMEGPYPYNVYRGTATFDKNGEAVVRLPEYFESINANYSYYLTPIGAPMPNLYIKKEIENNMFVIAGGIPGKKVSWMVVADRNDPYVQKAKPTDVAWKHPKIRGKFYHPELYGYPKSMGIVYSKMLEMRNSIAKFKTAFKKEKAKKDKPSYSKASISKKQDVKFVDLKKEGKELR